MAWDGARPPLAQRAARDLHELGVPVTLGTSGSELLADRAFACVIKSPGIDSDLPLLRDARARGIEIVDEAELGWRLDSRPMVAVTGTNGKSTVAEISATVLRAAGANPCVAGNRDFGPPLSEVPREHDVVVGELSSFQLEGCPGLLPEAALFTNLTPHHLKRHGSVERYQGCKRRLFIRGDEAVGLAILNLDDPFGRRLAAETAERGGRAVGYGRAFEADFRIEEIEWTLATGRVGVATPEGRVDLHSRLPGPYNAHNLVAVLALAAGLGVAPGAAAATIAEASPVPGRLEVIQAAPPFDVIVDYAHDPAGTSAVAGLARKLLERRGGGRLTAVVCAVDVLSDAREQRAIGAAAARLCDRVVLTSARWALAEPPHPPGPLVDGARAISTAEIDVVDDRADAIGHAILSAGDGDCVLILGRGPLDTPLFDSEGTPRPFDDREEARRALRELGLNRSGAG